MSGIVTLILSVLLMLPNKPLAMPQFVPGDLNRDGVVTQADVDIAMQLAVGLISPTQYQRLVGDMNMDGRINSADCAIIMRLIDG